MPFTAEYRLSTLNLHCHHATIPTSPREPRFLGLDRIITKSRRLLVGIVTSCNH